MTPDAHSVNLRIAIVLLCSKCARRTNGKSTRKKVGLIFLCVSSLLHRRTLHQSCFVSVCRKSAVHRVSNCRSLQIHIGFSLRPGSLRCRCPYEKRRGSQACVIGRWYPNTSHDIRSWCDWSDTEQLSEGSVGFMEGNACRLLPLHGERSHEDAFYNYVWKQLDGVWFTRWTRFADAGGEFNECHFEEQAPHSHPCGLPEFERTEVAQRDVKFSLGGEDARVRTGSTKRQQTLGACASLQSTSMQGKCSKKDFRTHQVGRLKEFVRCKKAHEEPVLFVGFSAGTRRDGNGISRCPSCFV